MGNLLSIQMNRREALIAAARLAGLAWCPFPVMPGKSAPDFNRADFGDDFTWGVATAAYQIEGAWREFGKGPSIWDTFAHGKKNIRTGENADVSTDFFHRYRDDLKLLKSLNFKAFRFSLSWPRLLPDGTGIVNRKGIDFYNRVIDTCLSLDIEPWITLYHWDLPQTLEDRGGWTNRDIVDWFTAFTHIAAGSFGDRVKNWMILNEPFAFTTLGYMLGMHAPGRKGLKNYLPAIHHTALCQAEGARILRSMRPEANIGTTFSVSPTEPYKNKPGHDRAAKRMDALLNRLFLEPALGLGYPVDTLPFLNRIVEKIARPGDLERLAFDFDFIGIQHYFRLVTRNSIKVPYIWANEVKPRKRDIPEEHITDMGWEVHPDSIYNILRQVSAYPGVKKILVTENGAAFPDTVEEGAVHDASRVAYYRQYLENVLRAKQDGVPVDGYFCWSFTDNFEWSEGFRPRFGLVYVDYDTQKRIVKDSGKWFQDFLK